MTSDDHSGPDDADEQPPDDADSHSGPDDPGPDSADGQPGQESDSDRQAGVDAGGGGDAASPDRVPDESDGIPVVSSVRQSYLLKFTLALVALVALVAALGVVFHAQATETIESDVEETFRLQAESEADELRQWRSGYARFTRSAAEARVFAANETASIRTHLDRKLNATDPGTVEAIHLVSVQDQRILVSTDSAREGSPTPQSLLITDVSFESFDDVDTSKPYRVQEGNTVVAFLSPVRQNPGTLLVVVVNVSSVDERFRTPIEGGFTRVVDSTGQLLFTSETGTGVVATGTLGVRQRTPGKSGVTRRRVQTRAGSVEYVVAYAPVAGTNWQLVKYAPAEEAFAVADQIRTGIVAFVGLSLLGVVVIGATLGRSAVLAITTLARDAKRVTAGEPDVAFDVDRDDEIGDLASALATMRQSLQDRIAEAEAATERLDRANRTLAEQRTIISVLNRVLRHNLRNTINVAQAHAEIISERTTDESIRHSAETIIERTEELIDSSEKARDIDALTGEAGDINQIDIALVTRTVLGHLAAEFPDATIRADLPDTADARTHVAISTAIENLVENAIEHNEADDPEVIVTVEETDEWVELVVRDNGPGIPDHEVEVITSVERESAMRHTTGLGLWLSSWIIREGDGEIEFEEHDDGTTIKVRLPRATPEASTGQQSPEEDVTGRDGDATDEPGVGVDS